MLRSTYPIKEDFLRAAESQGIPVVDDLQDLHTGHGAEHWYASPTKKGGFKIQAANLAWCFRLKWINRDVSKHSMLGRQRTRRSATARAGADTVCLQTGRRSDSAHAYVHATRAVHSNLYLACNTKVDKVILENGRAVAVQTV